VSVVAELPEEIRSAVDGALDNQTPMLIAYTDDGATRAAEGRKAAS
jgi:hypothetical protein